MRDGGCVRDALASALTHLHAPSTPSAAPAAAVTAVGSDAGAALNAAAAVGALVLQLRPAVAALEELDPEMAAACLAPLVVDAKRCAERASAARPPPSLLLPPPKRMCILTTALPPAPPPLPAEETGAAAPCAARSTAAARALERLDIALREQRTSVDLRQLGLTTRDAVCIYARLEHACGSLEVLDVSDNNLDVTGLILLHLLIE